MVSGFGFLLGTGDLPRSDDCESDLEGGTTAPARRDGFLCVCCEGSTFRRPAVTASPFESWSKIAPISPPWAAEPFGGKGGAGGVSNVGKGGGGGGPELDDRPMLEEGSDVDSLGVASPDWT